ncbi:aspartate/glutamate racemase family protein, partial [Candidatus Entotheonella palauensis]|uniref:aspartate/glutamate racemase family protein n=1 Tax=Candidatus Entotheonella palauensis TaxID=93172 RepID=UPI0030B95C13
YTTRVSKPGFFSWITVAAGERLVRDQGAEAVLLGGTDLNVVYDRISLDFPVIDSAAVHVDAIVNMALAQS